LASNDAAFEMGNFIRTLKRLLMESRAPLAWRVWLFCWMWWHFLFCVGFGLGAFSAGSSHSAVDSHMECMIAHGIMYEAWHERSELCCCMSFRWCKSWPGVPIPFYKNRRFDDQGRMNCPSIRTALVIEPSVFVEGNLTEWLASLFP
jgi:hypothetical protein